jgi:hypothetical protein
MELFAPEIEKLLQGNYKYGAALTQTVYLKIFNPYGAGTWYIMNQDPDDSDYLWCIADLGHGPEAGSVLKSELVQVKVPPYNMPLERDLHFTPKSAQAIYDMLRKGEHV